MIWLSLCMRDIATGHLGLQWVTWDCNGSTSVAAGPLQLQRVGCYCGLMSMPLGLVKLQQIVTHRYSDNKCKFKDKWFNKKTVEQARHENHRSGKLRCSVAEASISFYSKVLRYLIATRFYVKEDDCFLLAEMKAIQDAITAGAIPPKTVRQIFAEVTRSTNRAHIAGVGRNLASTAIWILGEEQRKAFQSQQNALKKFVYFFKCQQGTPASQFQIPDLYTPQVFPDSISTPGGPSSTSPAPSSTPLGLGNCYTLTFDPETSRSGEQDDNDIHDGNREYDVDVYDDE
ncbi:hypothetical protein Tco_0389062 [Tanacetum coccineum]